MPLPPSPGMCLRGLVAAATSPLRAFPAPLLTSTRVQRGCVAARPRSKLVTPSRSLSSTPLLRRGKHDRRYTATNAVKSSYTPPPIKNYDAPVDHVHFTAMCIRSILRSVGPIPLSKLTPLIPDEFLETLARERMSLVKLIETHPTHISAVSLPGPIVIAVEFSLCRAFDSVSSRSVGLRAMALLSVAHYFAGLPQATALGLHSSQPTTQELSRALARWTHIDAVKLEKFLQSHPTLFSVAASTHRVRLLVVRAAAPSAEVQRTMVGQLDRLQTRHAAQRSQETPKFALWLRTVVPSQYHVPVSHVLLRARELNVTEVTFGTYTPTLAQVKSCFQQLPAGFADIRAFGDSPSTVFVRVIDPEPLLLDSGVPTYGVACDAPELETAQFNPTQLAHELTQTMADYAAQSALTRARVVKGLEMSRLRDYVPPALMRRLELFYGFSERDDPRVCILVLDRLRHLWEVRLGEGIARPWACMPATEMPSSLTLQTSPSPRVLLHCQRLLLECGPQPPAELYQVLPPDLKAVFMAVYGDPAAPAGGRTACDSAAIEAAVQRFLHPHSLFFFTKDGFVHASRSLAARNASGGPGGTPRRQDEGAAGGEGPRARAQGTLTRQEASIADKLQAKLMYENIPPGGLIVCDALRARVLQLMPGTAPTKDSNGPHISSRREFFNRHSNLFNLHTLFGYDKMVVSRAGDKLEDQHLLCPPIRSVTHLIKFMALLSLDSISDTSLTRRLPPSGRSFLRQLGTAVDVAEQLPMFFAVQRDEINFGASLIRYIGPVAETPRSPHALKPHPSGVLTRKVLNDPFANIEPDAVVQGGVDGWNDDWHEDDDDGCG